MEHKLNARQRPHSRSSYRMAPVNGIKGAEQEQPRARHIRVATRTVTRSFSHGWPER